MQGLLNNLGRKITNLVKFGAISRASTDGGKYQVAQLESIGRATNATLVIPFGMAANPPAGTIAVMLSPGGEAGNAVAIPIYGESRKHPLAVGEVAVGAFPVGAYLIFRADGKFALGNQTGELLKQIEDLLGALKTATVVDPVSGALPFSASVIAQFTAIEAIIQSMRGEM